MKFLVTGGAGFLGSNLAAEALNRGHELAVLDNLSRSGATENLQWLRSLGDVQFEEVDIRHAGEVARVVKEVRPDVIFHLAGQVAMTTSLKNPRYDFEVNALGTLNVLEAMRQSAPEAHVLYSSTNKVYGDLEWTRYEELPTRWGVPEFPNGFPENIPLEFHSPYGCSKGTGDQYMLDYARIYGLNTTVFRHSSMYGGRQFATVDQGWIGWFCHQAVAASMSSDVEPFTICGKGKQVRDLLHAEDAVALYFAALDHRDAVAGKVFNIGGGMENSLSLLELFAFLESELNVKLRWIEGPPRESDQRVFVADVSKIQAIIPWAPKLDKAAGVRKMLEWVTTSGGTLS
ncbi:NAD-dependent epimerase/dehydratase family protein [Blastopirellula marina]|uniref:CDP-paratose 2-epimerase n=1 Tax=Blastopirellula marina TaxID=124 RepID=A0A2S8G716_9BACT|nr:NAD-dependent epimerase/dehydratase family protein [Blastopirellula marina]PQO40041.1 CDP-paratose 2-epimerase [Blastopirellula marina]PQO43664.1 CDP-paratose 2-epimerase [Blastopirellula marina]PTL45416.1 KR domain-containing protein [Blastopirellula marina]